MHALVITSNPHSSHGEALLKAIAIKLGLKHIRSEAYLCQFADRHIQRLVGRVKRRQVLIDQDLRANGVPQGYQAHVAVRGEDFSEEREILKQFEQKLRASGYLCQLLVSNPSGELSLVADLA